MFAHNHLSVIILKWDKRGDNARPSFTSKVPRNYNLGSLLTLTLVLRHYQLKMSYQGKLCSATTRLRRTRLLAAMTEAAKQIPKYTADPTFTAVHLPFSLWPCHPSRADSVTEAPIQLGVDDRELLSGPAGKPPYGKSTAWKSPDGEPSIRLSIWGGCGRKLLTTNGARVAEG